MQLEDFANSVEDFGNLLKIDKVLHFAWFHHVHGNQERFSTGDIVQCFTRLHLEKPNVSDTLSSLERRSPKVVLKDTRGWRLARDTRLAYDAKYANRPASITVDQMLNDLPSKITDTAKRKYLTEAINCYRVKAYRATTVMVWNLAYDHLLNYILKDATRLASFNAEIPRQYPRRTSVAIAKRDDFEEFKESEVLRIVGASEHFPASLKRILEEKLGRRNRAAHPAEIEVTQYQAEDTITDLVQNVILKIN